MASGFLAEDKKISISFHSYPDVNDGRAFFIDIILVYDVVLNKILMETSSDTYFNTDYRNTLKRENFNSVEIISRDIVPGKSYPPITLEGRRNKLLINCIIFCNIHENKKNIPKKVILHNVKKAIVLLKKDGAFLRK